jgi:16S rRNA (uracil1498-N3)-methyltransferase
MYHKTFLIKEPFMRISRLFVHQPLSVDKNLQLDAEAAHYLGRVLRLRVGETCHLFNGDGQDYIAEIREFAKKYAVVTILSAHRVETESPLALCLNQAIARPEHMDLVMQKAVELGAHEIRPILTARCQGLSNKRLEKRALHWQKIIQNACEQSGRAYLPTLHPSITLEEHLTAQNSTENITSLMLDPLAQQASLPTTSPHAVQILIGPEGGLNPSEIEAAQQANYQGIRLGSRILRTETAAICAMSLCQAQWGDWSV